MKKKRITPAARAMERRLGPCKRAAVGLSILSAIQALLGVALAFATRQVVNAAVGGENLILPCVLLAAVAAAIPLTRAACQYLAGRRADREVTALRKHLLQQLQKKDCETVNGYHSSHLFTRLDEDCRLVCERYTRILPETAGQVAQLIGAAGALVLLQTDLAVAMLILGVLAAAYAVVYRRAVKSRYRTVRRKTEQSVACLQENLEHLELSRSAAAEGETVRRYDRRQTAWRKARTALRRVSVGGSAGFSLAVQLASAALIVWGASAIHGGALDYGGLIAVLQLVSLFRAPVTTLTGIQGQLASADAARERVEELLALPDEPRGEEIAMEETCVALVFDCVTFRYEGEEQPVLQNYSARIEFGCWTRLTGSSGRGKSTLFRLILGLYRPSSGRIYVETDRRTVPVSAATRRLFGFVPQSPVLFSGTVRENLLLADPDADEQTLWEALELARCGFVRDLPQGLDTTLGQFGAGLSVGQRQRLTVARMLLRPARMLLLDEVTSALDQQTAEEMLAGLSRRCPTALISTHRQSILRRPEIRDLALEAPGEET